MVSAQLTTRIKAHLKREISISQGTIYLLMAWAFFLGFWPYRWTRSHWWLQPMTFYFAGLFLWSFIQVRRRDRQDRRREAAALLQSELEWAELKNANQR